MFKIDKKEEPEFFKKFKTKKKPKNWKDYTPQIKENLKKYMFKEEQGYYCVYCENNIDLENSQIEHIKPKDIFPELTHEYSNYIVGCINSKTCGQYKLKQWSDKFINPTLENPEDYLTYDIKTGKIVPKEKEGLKKEKAIYTIEILNLNENRLCNIRRRFILENIGNMESIKYTNKFPSLKKYLIEHYGKK